MGDKGTKVSAQQRVKAALLSIKKEPKSTPYGIVESTFSYQKKEVYSCVRLEPSKAKDSFLLWTVKKILFKKVFCKKRPSDSTSTRLDDESKIRRKRGGILSYFSFFLDELENLRRLIIHITTSTTFKSLSFLQSLLFLCK